MIVSEEYCLAAYIDDTYGLFEFVWIVVLYDVPLLVFAFDDDELISFPFEFTTLASTPASTFDMAD